MKISLPGCAVFTLRGKADRIDRLKAGGLAIIDYKTGGAPSDRQIQTGYAPQLPLEALMAAAGKFADVPAERVAALAYWQLKGGRIIAEQTTVKGDPMGLAAFYRSRLETLIATFNDPDMPYHPLPDPKFVPLFRLYDHLSRRAEWGVVASDDMDDVL
jgi:ATP-dependent helicase/nuclease subunit B